MCNLLPDSLSQSSQQIFGHIIRQKGAPRTVIFAVVLPAVNLIGANIIGLLLVGNHVGTLIGRNKWSCRDSSEGLASVHFCKSLEGNAMALIFCPPIQLDSDDSIIIIIIIIRGLSPKRHPVNSRTPEYELQHQIVKWSRNRIFPALGSLWFHGL